LEKISADYRLQVLSNTFLGHYIFIILIGFNCLLYDHFSN
jgi:hypothetical protein